VSGAIVVATVGSLAEARQRAVDEWPRGPHAAPRRAIIAAMQPMPPPARAVLDFWFGAPPHAARAEWFRKDDAFDATIRTRFGGAIDEALAGRLQDWDATPAGALARVLLLDQFTRNAFRGTPRAFAGDALALAAVRAMVARGDDRALAPLERVFVYLPFEHAEDAAMQRESLRLFEALAPLLPPGDPTLDYARRHAAVIERFGRFPHRNTILGRASTAEETAFLREPGSSF
jgi:uncharacterized protein (DUF924 family)